MASHGTPELPAEIAIKVCDELLNLDDWSISRQTLRSLRLVNRAWSQPATEALFRNKKIDPLRFFERLEDSSGLAPYVEELKFSWDTYSNGEDLSSHHAGFSTLTKVKKITIDVHRFGGPEWLWEREEPVLRGWISSVQSLVPYFRDLQKVSLLGPPAFVDLMVDLKLPRPLHGTELRYTKNTLDFYTGPLVPAILANAESMKNLRHLILDSDNWYDGNLDFSFANGPSTTELRTMYLAHVNLVDNSLHDFIDKLSKTMDSIKLNGVEMTLPSWAACMDVMADCRNLSTLELAYIDTMALGPDIGSFRLPRNLVRLTLVDVMCEGMLLKQILAANRSTLQGVWLERSSFRGTDKDNEWNLVLDELLACDTLSSLYIERLEGYEAYRHDDYAEAETAEAHSEHELPSSITKYPALKYSVIGFASDSIDSRLGQLVRQLRHRTNGNWEFKEPELYAGCYHDRCALALYADFYAALTVINDSPSEGSHEGTSDE